MKLITFADKSTNLAIIISKASHLNPTTNYK